MPYNQNIHRAHQFNKITHTIFQLFLQSPLSMHLLSTKQKNTFWKASSFNYRNTVSIIKMLKDHSVSYPKTSTPHHTHTTSLTLLPFSEWHACTVNTAKRKSKKEHCSGGHTGALRLGR